MTASLLRIPTAQEETYEPAPPRPVPAPPAADVKYNTAAILREEFLYQKRAEKEAKALKNIEEALRDGQDYEVRRCVCCESAFRVSCVDL